VASSARLTPFHFEHEFRAPSPAKIFEAYFDPALAAEEDRRVDILRREVLELEDTAESLRRVCKVVPRRQLPAVLRPFLPGELHYVERLRWIRADDAIEIRIEPSLLGGRVEIASTYRVEQAGAGRVIRVYEGHVSVELRLLGGRVERSIVEDIAKSLPIAAACTQEWLDLHA
jgi:hypothetical protein